MAVVSMLVRRYTVQIREALYHQRAGFSLTHTLRVFPRWLRSCGPAGGVIGPEPWLPFRLIDAIGAEIGSSSRVFEYGSGASTIFFGLRCAEVVSIEHSAEWAERVRAAATGRGLSNVRIEHVPPGQAGNRGRDPADPALYVSSAAKYAGYSFEAYARSIDRYPDGYFHLVLVDGRVRPSCVTHAQRTILSGEQLVLDDSERPHYRRIVQELASSGWSAKFYFCPSPYGSEFRQAAVFRRP